MASYTGPESEQEILAFWQEQQTYAKLQELRQQGEQFYFLDGPPYTSGKVHLGTAWNKVLKDMVLRYKRMRGQQVWDRAGYDMHGLPTEHATQKKLNLASKEDIEQFGIAKFITECRKLCIENMELMNQDFHRLGVWMDFKNAYQSITDEFIEGEWWLVKRAHEQQRLYEGLRSMTWCPDCASALAKHECEYQTVHDPSIFVKFPVQGEENTFLIIWTTTPWTIPFNLAIMVNPDLPYQKCKVEKDGKTEQWIVAQALAAPLIQNVANATYEVVDEFPGAKLEGMNYSHPFEQFIPDFAQLHDAAPKTHTVVLSKEYVDTTAGSGLVHCAPGCGPEDFEVGHANNIPPFNLVQKDGSFPDSLEKFAGKYAKKDDKYFIELLDELGFLVATTNVEHDYPHCWRHHTPVIFRTTKQWFFKVEDIKEQLIKENNAIEWMPRAAYNAFDSWLKNLRDNSITKQRYWGTPVPIWKCECGHYAVVGSKAELHELAGRLPEDLHKPWIDEITWKCTACKEGEMRRIPDILDVWVDAGTTSWNCLDYLQDPKKFDELFPADFILEGKDQIRGWFNLLHIASMIALGRPSFKKVYMHGFINDAQGRKMSKSLGNYILPSEVIDKYGANTFRYYAIGAANPGLDMNYNFEEVELKHRNLLVYWNIHNFLLEMRRLGVAATSPLAPGVEEQYILSRLHSTIMDATEQMEQLRLNEVPHTVESLLLDLSRNYMQLTREKAAQGTAEERALVLQTAFTVFHTGMQLFSIVAPMFSESVHQNLRDAFSLSASIHHDEWPIADTKLINRELETQFSKGFDIIAAILAARDSAQLGVRWPAAEARVDTAEKESAAAVTALHDVLAQHVNVKKITVGALENITWKVEPNYRALGKVFGEETGKVANLIKQHAAKLGALLSKDEMTTLDGYEVRQEHVVIERLPPDGWAVGSFAKGMAYLNVALTPELEAEGYAREVIRRVQQLRKDAGLQKDERIEIALVTPELLPVIETFGQEIKTKTGTERIVHSADGFENVVAAKIKGKQLQLALRKL